MNPDQIANLGEARQVIQVVLNLVEELKQENAQLRAEVQHLRAEVRRLKGEQGQPTFKASKPKPGDDHSSERERKRKSLEFLARNLLTPCRVLASHPFNIR